MKKRGYFFTVDVSIAMIIIVVGFLLIWSFYITEPGKGQPYFYTQDVIDFLSNTPIWAVSSIQYLIMDGNITNIENTLLEQITLSYINDNDKPEHPCQGADCKTYAAQKIINDTINNLVPKQYGVTVLFNHSLLYTVNSSIGRLEGDSELLVSAKKMVVVVINKVNLSDPYMMEVRVWR